MSNFRDNLKLVRGNIIFLVGLTLAFSLVYALDRWEKPPIELSARTLIEPSDIEIEPTVPRPLTLQERQWAQIAWKYFENNTVDETGLVNSVDGYPASTMWDTSSYLLGLISAHRLDIVTQEDFNGRVERLLDSLASMPLFDGKLPNKSYNTITTDMVTYDNETTERGIGWSAIDIGRVMVPLNILVWQYPNHTEKVERVLSHWQLGSVVADSEMIGTDLDENDKILYLQEGRLGYEEYASKSLVLVGLDLSKALDYEAYLDFATIYDTEIGTDLRTPEDFGALNFVVSEPYVLDGLEFGFDRHSRELAKRIYHVQKARYENTGTLTAVSEDNIDQSPYFVYNTVFADGKAWNAITETGEDASEFRSLSSKAAFGLHALFNTSYTQLLMDNIKDNYDEDKGWYSGIYEKTGKPNKAITGNTNGIILEALHYIQYGPLLAIHQQSNSLVASSELEN